MEKKRTGERRICKRAPVRQALDLQTGTDAYRGSPWASDLQSAGVLRGGVERRELRWFFRVCRTASLLGWLPFVFTIGVYNSRTDGRKARPAEAGQMNGEDDA
jgi:hypothetical protein